MSAASRELQNVIFHQFTLSEDGNSNSGQCSSQLLSGSEFIIELKFFQMPLKISSHVSANIFANAFANVLANVFTNFSAKVYQMSHM